METCNAHGVCPLMYISWLWYAISVIVVFLGGSIWYGKLFAKPWARIVGFKKQNEDLDSKEDKKCTFGIAFPIAMQLVATALLGLMYFILAPMSVCGAIVVAVAISGWMKATLVFKTPEVKNYFMIAIIEVGYFFIASMIFIAFALIK